MAETGKPLYWAGSSKHDLLAFPDAVVDMFGHALGDAQEGRKSELAKPWKGEGPGVWELADQFEGNAFRAVYAVRFAKAVYVLHCFQKKSPSGIRTAKHDADLIHSRLQAARMHYEKHYGKD